MNTTDNGEQRTGKGEHKRPVPLVTCPVCEQRFSDYAGCNIHIGKVHVERKPSAIEERLDAIERRLLRVEGQFTPIGRSHPDPFIIGPSKEAR